MALLTSLITIALVTFSRSASALPPAGTDTFGVNAQVSIESRLGSETIPFTGTVTINRQAPHNVGGVEVEDTAITALDLDGLSATGFVSLSQSPTRPSTGELRSQQAGSQFPASSFFDVFIEALVPSSGSYTTPPFVVHNEDGLHLVPLSDGSEAPINGWPPFDVKYGASPDSCIHMLREVPDPRNPDPWLPAQICVTNVTLTLGLPPTPTPTSTPCPTTCPATSTPTQGPVTPTRTPRPTSTPTSAPTPVGPEDPTFSVARGDPSGFHPAALLRLGEGGPIPPVEVSGNDDFSNAWSIGSKPFSGTQSTAGFTTQAGEPLNSAASGSNVCNTVSSTGVGATAWFRLTAVGSGPVAVDTNGSGYDTVLAVYAGSAMTTLTALACDDDGGVGLQSALSFDATADTTYYIQAAGFAAYFGNLRLNVTGSGVVGAGGGDVTVAISCDTFGLSGDGCDDGSDGDQDDIDALSYGADTQPNENPIAFSVAPGSQGVAGSAVAAQAACSPAEPQADEFTSGRDGTNVLVLDGDGQGSGCPGGYSFGLTERPVSDNLDALDGHSPDFVDEDRDGLLDHAVFFSLAPGSPSLVPAGFSPADILWTIGFSPGLYVDAETLGLQAADDIDGLCLDDRGPDEARYDPATDRVLFSLKSGSPTLAALHANAGDVLAPGPSIRYHAAELGLRPSDDLDAMKCFEASGSSTVKVIVGDTESVVPPRYWFCDQSYADGVCETKINVGDTVAWNWVGTAPHDVTECGASCPPPLDRTPVFGSGLRPPGSHFEFTFNTPGTYLYFCAVHGPQQMGRIVVNGPGGGTPTPTRTGQAPTPTRTPTPPARPGDGNCSGRVDAIDAALILQNSAGLLHTLPCPQNGDVNGDGRINAIDAQLILQFVAGLLPQLPP